MPKLDRYLFGEMAQATFGTLVVLLMVSFGGVFADVLGDIARGTVPAGMILAQLGLVLLNWLPLILPLGLMLGLMLAVGRLYRDSEMPVFASIGVGPGRLLRPLLQLVLPVVVAVGACSLWLGPWAKATSQRLIHEANRNLIIAGLEPGSFTELPGGGGVVYVGSMSADGTQLQRVFIYRHGEERFDVTTANNGALRVDDNGERYITLYKGFQVEGPFSNQLDWRLMRYGSNVVRLPSGESRYDPTDPDLMATPALLGDDRREAQAQLHFRLAPPLLTLAFALMAIPLARTSPRQSRFSGILIGFLAYVFGLQLTLMGTDWLEDGKVPVDLGLWWLLAPLLLAALWLYARDGRIRGPRRRLAEAAR